MLPHEMFDETIFERMEADDDQSSSHRQSRQRRIQSRSQLTQLIVDEHPQRLKATGCRMLAITRYHTLYELRQLTRTQDGRLLALTHDGIGDTTGVALFAEFSNHALQLRLCRHCEPLRSRKSGRRIHAHVEWAILRKTETPLWLIELRRGNAQIEQNAKHRLPRRAICNHIGELGEWRMHELESRIPGKSLLACSDRLRVAIDRDKAPCRTDGIQDLRTVPAATKSRIDVKASRLRRKTLEHFFDKHGKVLIHGHPCHNDNDSSSVDKSVAVSSLLSQNSRRSFQSASSHNSRRVPWPINIACRVRLANLRNSGGTSTRP